jgi:thioester reductase-like protein
MFSRPDGLTDQEVCVLTGATGALGQELLYQMMEWHPKMHLVVIARNHKNTSAEKRIHSIVNHRWKEEARESVKNRITVLDGDVSAPKFGLNQAQWDELASVTTQVLHCAAIVRFDQPLAEARRINLEGSSYALDLARAAYKAGNAGRFNYVSTAYIAGKRSGIAYENELEHKTGFHNTYEQTKYEAEIMVRNAMQELPATIMRPSIIIGNSRTGETINYKAFYWPIRAYASNQLRVMPAGKDCKVDLVPVDYVASSTAYLSTLPDAVGKFYHLTAGRDNLLTVREVAYAAMDFFKVKKPIVVHPRYFKLLEGPIGQFLLGERYHKTLKVGAPYFPYLGMRLEFDNRMTAATLAKAGLVAPHVRDFFDTLFRYCLETDWGKKHPPERHPEKPETPQKELVTPQS